MKAQQFDPRTTRFDGPDYDAERDNIRLTGQVQRVFDAMVGGEWRTLNEISLITGDPAASVSAQLRHLRKPRFGGHTVNKKYLGDGLYTYQLIPNTSADPEQLELIH